ncbi:hypothetical protein H6F77_24520 [Microcoleus sp. FACHB-831]|uniref:hypothetical protein n=1 Tax=Microcoleus sp. FACHB-831 TaxID=2692827 RepID=UPI001687DE36|nr:hypothetical protein [Microcoleus sp. FACHB-831]MBD1924210.1 hypothetical protein [Microcoleus sp. FACHB-831]
MDFIVNLIINFLISWLAPKIGDRAWKMLLEMLAKLRDRISQIPDDWDDYDGGL